ncbi:unnamed protein product [Cylicocyclus nassatus]|uniref:Uncharacterized protein n=1 Tax=Cylicocyclus nassatus TaxID=53992 RepID=A0AA36MEB5_CYLNA|nr:unnamed protein product [Cylicocyclus nassatus]
MKRGDSRPSWLRHPPLSVAVRCESPLDSLRWQSATLHHLEMSAVDGADPNVALEPLDAKAEEEERYRLKMVALQECYDNVALQSVRLRERIYQVKKQCRRLEVMKRVALNMLHQNTGTYDIPPLEIVDEDPLPSFLESLHKQQHVVAEPPRKKSKRPSRSKSDGKPTPEEEERAKQKIYSIIDSVYSETARRMGDALKKPSRNPNMMTASSSEQSSRKVGDLTMSSNHTSPGEANVKTIRVEHEIKPEIHKDSSSIPLNQGDVAGAKEQSESGHTLTSFDAMAAAYEPLMNSDESMAYDSGPLSSKTSHNMSASSSSLGFTYGDSNDGVQDLSRGASASNSPAYEATLETLQSMNYHFDGDGLTPNIQKPVDCEVPREGNSMYNLTNSIVSPVQNHSDNMDPGRTAPYSKIGCPNKAVLSNEREHLSQHTDLTFDKSLSSSPHHLDGEKMNHASGSGDPPQPSKKSRLTARNDVKQDTKTAIAPPLPNYIPYRMIEVETPKPVEVITIDSGDETSSPKQIRKRRRKYKYVVESVLDNVPYTFRQAESDDEEVADKQSTTVSTPVRTATD